MAQGRYQLGVGIGALPTDHDLFGLDNRDEKNRRMAFESIDIMTRLWTEGATDFQGEFWATGAARSDLPGLGYHLAPYQTPHPPIAITGLTSGSENLKLAGEKGYIPVSLSPNGSVTARHWDAVVEGAARTGRVPDRNEWRIIRDVYVAPTDAEARELAIGGIMGRCWREFLLPIYLGLGFGQFLTDDPSIPDDAVDLEYLADNLWFVGSPTTVADKILELHQQTGGFGHLLTVSYDSTDERESWDRSLRLLIDEVLPRCQEPSAARLSAPAEAVA
jgi:alkanesulfonate monooxygenase SsuD/methylene tetrahydromethanopterin reductase-like flavin-dependent oxidoreductase (luciferase family)